MAATSIALSTRISSLGRGRIGAAIAGLAAAWIAAGATAGPPLLATDEGRVVEVAVDTLRQAPSGAPFAIEGVEVPGWGRVDVQLERFRVMHEGAKVVAGTGEGDGEISFDPESVVLLRGSVPGLAGSHAVMAITSSGTTGRLELGPGRPTVSLASAPGVDVPGVERVEMRPMPVGAGAGPLTCSVAGRGDGAGGGADSLPGPGGAVGVPGGGAGGAPGSGAASAAGEIIRGLKQVELAVDADHEYFLLMGDEQAALEYITMVYGFASDIMMRDLRARIDLVWVRVWMEPDPYGPTAGFPIFHPFEVGADQAQFFGAERLHYSGGVAYVCGQLSLVSHILGFTGDPLAPNVYNRDMKVIAHELGHTLGSGHTHDYGLDECHRPWMPRRGTIMSYCFYFNGGIANVDHGFHAAPRGRIASCMRGREFYAFDCNQNGIDDSEDIESAFSLDANGNGIPDECEDCNNNGILDDADIASGASLDLNENGVPDECEPDCNGNGVPDDLDILGYEVFLFRDDFEIDRGWIAENLGATAGDWDREAPIADPAWTHAPRRDADGSGKCWLTDNSPGESDVDDGAVRLTSPRLDFSGGGADIHFAYYLTLLHPGDGMRVGVSDDDGVTWYEVRLHRSSTGWRGERISEAEILDAGAEITDRMRVRFMVFDNDPQSTVEAAIDAFGVIRTFDPVSLDENGNWIPDECEGDLDGDGRSDYLQIQDDMSLDVNRNAMLDAFEDCDSDGVPDLVALDSAWSGWVADAADGALREYHPVTGVLMRESALGVVETPRDVLITADRRILVSDAAQDRIVEFNARAEVVGDLVAPGAGGLANPGAMLVRGGELLVASAGTDSVLRFDVETGAALGALVEPGEGGLVRPYGMTFDSRGDLYVTSGDNQVMQYSPAGVFRRIFVSELDNGGLDSPRDILFTPAIDPPTPTPPAPARFLVASELTKEILEFDPDTGAFRHVFNIGTQDGKLHRPWGMVIGRDGEVYLSSRLPLESAGATGPGGGTAASHLTDPKIFQYQTRTGLLLRPYIQRPDSKLPDPVGFAFMPGDGIDCNFNQLPDSCDIASGFSADINGNGIPDECETCTADCDGSGALEFFDFLCFQTAFAAADPAADCDGSGDLNFFDFLCFQNGYAAGCE